MLSYALGSLAPYCMNCEESTEYYKSTQKGTGIFGFVQNRYFSIIKELEKYGNPKQDLIDKLSLILSNHNLNIRMLVAVDYWYRGNDMPQEFTDDMFTDKNIYFLKISSISFNGKKDWDKDDLSTFLTYANYLKNNVYLETGEITVIAEDENDNLYNFDIDVDEDEY